MWETHSLLDTNFLSVGRQHALLPTDEDSIWPFSRDAPRKLNDPKGSSKQHDRGLKRSKREHDPDGRYALSSSALSRSQYPDDHVVFWLHRDRRDARKALEEALVKIEQTELSSQNSEACAVNKMTCMPSPCYLPCN
jgi:hypothetical protein